MTPISEIEAITTLDNVLSQFQDTSTRERVLKWALDKFGTKSQLTPKSTADNRDGHQLTKKKTKTNSKKSKPSSKARIRPSILKDLNLSPKGKKTFKDFAQQKQPESNQEKCTVSIYYLQQELGIDTVSVNHIYTCYKNIGWKVANLYNVLAITASRKGWIDTRNMEAIILTTHGENLVEHDLPRPKKDKA